MASVVNFTLLWPGLQGWGIALTEIPKGCAESVRALIFLQ